MTAAFVLMLVAILFIVVMPGELGKAANVDATQGVVSIGELSFFEEDGITPVTAKELEISKTYVVKTTIENVSTKNLTEVQIEADISNSLNPEPVKTKYIETFNAGDTSTVAFKFSVKNTAKAGNETISISVSGLDGATPVTPVSASFSYKIKAQQKNTPILSIEPKSNYVAIKPSTNATLTVLASNTGLADAQNVFLTCESGFGTATGITKDYTSDYINVGTISAGSANSEISVKIKIGSNVADGLHELVFSATYEDADGNTYKTGSMTMYLEYKKPATTEVTDDGLPYEPVKGYTFEEEIKPGKTTHVRTMITNYNSGAVGESQFDSFVLETSDERIVTSGLTLTDSSTKTLYYPNSNNSNNGYRNSYTGFGTYILEFDVSCADTIEKGKYKVTFYGVTLYDQNGYTPTTINQGDIVKPTRYPLISFTINNDSEAKSATVGIDKITYDKKNMMPASSNQFAVTIKNTGTTDISELYLVTELGDSLTPDYEMKKLRVGALSAGSTTTFKVPFTVKSSAVSGNTEVTFKLSGVDKYGRPVEETNETLFVRIGAGEATVDAPSLSLSTKQNYKLLVPSTDDSVIIRITNNGSRLAKNVRLSCEKGFGVGEGLTKSYTTSYIAVDDIPAGKTVKVEVPFLVGATFTKGIHELEFSATYLDEDKHEYKSDVMTMYVEHYKTGEIAEVDGLTYLLISGVTQTPNMPQAGERVTVSFNVKNKGTEKVTNLHFYATGLSAAGFQPVTGEPYQDEGSLEAGESKKVTMTFMAGEDIPKGVNSLSIGYDYFDASNKAQQSTTTIYVLNVVNHKFDDIDVGRPKIIVSDYSTEPEILRAGETFDFSYTLKNTHTGKEARNIKITLSQADGVIAPAQGTNIFYIDKLDPTQEVVLSLPLKSRADTVTGDYAVVLKLEYEYDDMSEVDKEHGGVSEENTLKIRVIENYRPVIENIFIDAYQGIMVGQPVDLSFEFYNMGKSTLGNVYITIEGDFALANNSAMSYVGAVQGYGQEYLSPQIVPLVGGEAHGTVTIHFEDSNGDEQTKSSDFQAWVEDPMGGGDFGGDWNMNFGNVSGGYYDWGGEFPEGMDFGEGFPGMEGEGEEEGFFASIPWWVWVIVGVVVVGGTVVIIVVVKKRKAKKEADEEDNEDI